MSGSKTSLHASEEEKKSGMDIEIEETLIYVGKRIRTERERLNLTREDIEELTGVSGDTIKRIEAGKPATTENLLRIVLALDVPIAILFPAPPRDKIAIRQEIDKLMDELVNM